MLDELVVEGCSHSLCARCNVEFSVDAFDVGANGVAADEERRGDRLVIFAFAEFFENLRFAARERRLLCTTERADNFSRNG